MHSDWVRPRAGQSPVHRAFVEARKAELRERMGEGGLREAVLRGLLHAVSAFGGADERVFEAIRRIREEHADSSALSLQDFKRALREQFFMLLIDRERALRSISDLLPQDEATRRTALKLLRRVVSAHGEPDAEVAGRLEEIEMLFGLRDRASGTLVAFSAEQPAHRRAGGA
jgi:hypothetical protein